jgi:putative peptidoglycan lipid II flippase
MMQKAFFALEDTKTPFIFTSIQIAIHITGSITLGFLAPKEWLVVSIALLTAFTVIIQGLIAYQMLRKRIGGLAGYGVGRSLGMYLLAVIPAAAVGVALLWSLGGISQGSFALDKVVTAVFTSALVGSGMLLVYLLLLWVMRVPDLREVIGQLRGRFGGK